jgi:hypothetical protein
MCRIGQLLYELANSLKLAHSMVRYMRIGHFGELANSVLQIAMSDPEQPGGLLSTHGNQYQHIQVHEGATAQLGNTFHISESLIDTNLESYHKLTRSRPRRPAQRPPLRN